MVWIIPQIFSHVIFFPQALALVTKAKQAELGLNSLEGPSPAGVITRGML